MPTRSVRKSVIINKKDKDTKLGVAFKTDEEGKVRVTEIGDGSVASKSRIQLGDAILSINGKATKTPKAVAKALRESQGRINIVVSRPTAASRFGLPSSRQSSVRSGVSVISSASSTINGSEKTMNTNGEGKRVFEDGHVYEGQWKDGLRCGTGTLQYANGDVYLGEWGNDKREGFGTYTFHDGHAYEGEWSNGVMHGVGKYTYTSGKYYEGQYQNGKRNGQGKVVSSSGVVKQLGTWIDGKFVNQ